MKFRNIKGYPLYKISRNGIIKRKDNGFILTAFKNKKGYLKVTLYNKEGHKQKRVNVLVAITWVPNPLNLPEVDHDDGNKLNNWDWNLKWVTQITNLEKAFKLGLRKGKLIRDLDLTMINDLFDEGLLSNIQIAKRIGVSRHSINKLKKLWRGYQGIV
jgi:hypothetical protein